MPSDPGTQRRGEELQRHILFAAKDVFLETGYERASMDAVAARAETSKRTLYARFENKDKLFLAVLDLVRELYLGKLRTPETYSDVPTDAVVLFCARFVELMTWEPQVRTCRLSVAEAERLPGNSSAYFDAMFTTTYIRLAHHLATHWGLEPTESEEAARDLLNQVALPRLVRTLLNVERPALKPPDDSVVSADIDLDSIRVAVLAALPHDGS